MDARARFAAALIAGAGLAGCIAVKIERQERTPFPSPSPEAPLSAPAPGNAFLDPEVTDVPGGRPVGPAAETGPAVPARFQTPA